MGEETEITSENQSGDREINQQEMDTKRKRTSTGIEATHQSVEQIISDIKNPDLDCRLEDIQALVDKANIVDENEDGEHAAEHTDEEQVGLLNPPTDSAEDESRVSPEFTRAAGLLQQTPATGFDPEDPKVKELEDWELRSQSHDKSLNLENENRRSLLNIFK